MNIFVSVVSHGHADLIKEINCLASLAQKFNVVVKCNKPGDGEALKSYCQENNITLLDESYGLGFGENNNYIYRHCENNMNLNADDYFIVLNPDLYIAAEQIAQLIENMQHDGALFGSINLFKNEEKTIYDNSIRKFPSLKDFLSSYILGVNKCIIDKSTITSPVNVDWTAGSFMAVKASHYKQLSGFNERYFMYCEDIDMCYRSWLAGVPVVYYPDIHALHFAKHANRSIFSRHFVWHMTSIFRFLAFKSSHRLG